MGAAKECFKCRTPMPAKAESDPMANNLHRITSQGTYWGVQSAGQTFCKHCYQTFKVYHIPAKD